MDILKKITEMRLEKNWTEYELAERSELTQSTLERICGAFGITLSQFFQDDETFSKNITKEQMEILNRWNRLTKDQRKKLADFLDSIG